MSDRALKHAAEFRRCLLELDVRAMRMLWQHVHPELPQPEGDDEVLQSMHMARVRAKFTPERSRRYSRHWLAERERRIAAAVGIAVKVPLSRRALGDELHHEMRESVLLSHREGLDLDLDAPEVRRRILKARARVLGIKWPS